MRLADFSALRDLAELFPRTKHNASLKLLFPEPFGPTITLIPLSKFISVFGAKDLKPCIESFLIEVMEEYRSLGI